MMRNNIYRALGFSTIVLLAGAGVAGCSASNADLTESEVKVTLDQFFDTVVDETGSAVSLLDTKNIDINTMTEDDVLEMFSNEFPESHSYISDDVSKEDAAMFVGSFSALDIFTPGDLDVEVIEDKIELDGKTAHVSGNSFILKIDGKEQPRTEESSSTAGSFDLKYIDGEWKIAAIDMGSSTE